MKINLTKHMVPQAPKHITAVIWITENQGFLFNFKRENWLSFIIFNDIWKYEDSSGSGSYTNDQLKIVIEDGIAKIVDFRSIIFEPNEHIDRFISES